jgi:hypothetical protein
VAAFAFAFNWATGHRGIFLLDQSMIFDGGWRILQGQTPYKDILFPFGPITFYVQALFFQIFGVNWTAMVIPACVFNCVAAMSVMRIVRLLSGGSWLLALCGGLATAVSFQAPFGTLWLEQTAVFFDLIALQAVVESLQTFGLRQILWQTAGGASLALAVLSKQNYGFLFIPVVLAVVATAALPDLRRALQSVMLVLIGVAAAAGIFLAWVWIFSDPAEFVHQFFVVAGKIGRSRMPLDLVAKAFFFENALNRCQIDLIGVVAGTAALFLACSQLPGKNPENRFWTQVAPVASLAILLPFFRSLTQATTLNEWQNNLAFVGLATCLGISLMARIAGQISVVPIAGRGVTLRLPSARTVTTGLSVAASVWAALALATEARAAWRRTVQEFEKNTQFRDAVHVRGLERVLWGEPIALDTTTTLADLERVAAYLSSKRGNFFVMGDSTLLYGLLGAPSPQPLLYFQPEHSFFEKDIPHLDKIVSESLKRNHVSVVVREKVTYLSENHDAYSRFPRIWAWFTSDFEHVSDFGNYEIWEQKHDDHRWTGPHF